MTKIKLDQHQTIIYKRIKEVIFEEEYPQILEWSIKKYHFYPSQQGLQEIANEAFKLILYNGLFLVAAGKLQELDSKTLALYIYVEDFEGVLSKKLEKQYGDAEGFPITGTFKTKRRRNETMNNNDLPPMEEILNRFAEVHQNDEAANGEAANNEADELHINNA